MMPITLIVLFSVYIAFYCFSFSRVVYKEGNKAGAAVTGLLALLALVSPFVF